MQLKTTMGKGPEKNGRTVEIWPMGLVERGRGMTTINLAGSRKIGSFVVFVYLQYLQYLGLLHGSSKGDRARFAVTTLVVRRTFLVSKRRHSRDFKRCRYSMNL